MLAFEADLLGHYLFQLKFEILMDSPSGNNIFLVSISHALYFNKCCLKLCRPWCNSWASLIYNHTLRSCTNSGFINSFDRSLLFLRTTPQAHYKDEIFVIHPSFMDSIELHLGRWQVGSLLSLTLSESDHLTPQRLLGQQTTRILMNLCSTTIA